METLFCSKFDISNCKYGQCHQNLINFSPFPTMCFYELGQNQPIGTEDRVWKKAKQMRVDNYAPLLSVKGHYSMNLILVPTKQVLV